MQTLLHEHDTYRERGAEGHLEALSESRVLYLEKGNAPAPCLARDVCGEGVVGLPGRRCVLEDEHVGLDGALLQKAAFPLGYARAERRLW
jgi:hypothetical protein